MSRFSFGKETMSRESQNRYEPDDDRTPVGSVSTYDRMRNR